MSEIALVTASFGGSDDVKTLPERDGIDAFYYTDEATRAGASAVATASWTSVLVPNHPRHDFAARLRSGYFKQQIHRLDEVREHRWLVWCDSSLQLHETRFIHAEIDKLNRLAPHQRCLLVPHPDRRTISQEYEFISGEIGRGNDDLRERDAQDKMAEQMAWFAARGWNLDARLWCGAFWIVENSALFRHCWDDWWDQDLRFGTLDQLSLQVILDQRRCEPQALDVLIWNNDHFEIAAKRVRFNL